MREKPSQERPTIRGRIKAQTWKKNAPNPSNWNFFFPLGKHIH